MLYCLRLAVEWKMRTFVYSFTLLFLLLVRCHTLTCRTEGDPKESDLKNMYMKCLKMQDLKNSNNTHIQNGQDHRNIEQNGEWDRGRKDGDERIKSRYSEMSNDYSKRNNKNDGNDNNDMNYRNDRVNNDYNRRNSGRGEDTKTDERNENSRLGSNDFPINQYDNSMSQYNGYYVPTQSPRRYKRERHEPNSGKRSQYNPNKQQASEDISKSDGKNSSGGDSSENVDSKACAMHCFLENLEMTGEDGLPDRYLVTHVLTKHVHNDDLNDFLHESIEECFQILGNENTDEKCEFSKNLLMCLSEKGRSNCDDWKDDIKF